MKCAFAYYRPCVGRRTGDPRGRPAGSYISILRKWGARRHNHAESTLAGGGVARHARYG
jgi:hypothetical protein